MLDRTTRLEQRASRIADPIERLRFLRQQTAGRPLSSARRIRPERITSIAALVLLTFATGPVPKGAAETVARERGLLVPRADVAAVPTDVPHVWRVEQSDGNEVYSNGLRIDLRYRISNRPRAKFGIYALNGSPAPLKMRETPVGIVYHMSESLVAPFEESETRRLKQLGRNLLEVIRSERAYHYVIDRFGRVYSVVAESDAANHAGVSIWSDADGIYVNLNDSFLAISFEGASQATNDVTPAQINSARLLTEMLRSRYSIAAENCVTHAQVSVNPLNMRIGNHVDWAQNFPFAALGLPNNYEVPLASVYVFGFKFDDTFLTVTGGRWKGLNLAAEQLEKQAAAEQTPLALYRKILQRRYQDIAATLKEQAEGGTE